jgi:hypothetical protein
VHRLATLILLISFIGQTFNQGFYYISYLVDKADYIAKCENRARPEMKCNGKCQLMKKIIELEKKNQGPAPEMKLAEKTEVLSSKSWYTAYIPVYINITKQHFVIHNIGMPVDQSFSFFHPPSI